MSETQRDAAEPPGARFSLVALCFGNFLIGTGIMAPAGMIAELSDHFAMSLHDVGSLIWIGGLMVAIGAPVLAWATTRIDRRQLLVFALGCYVIAHVLAALAPSFWVLVVARIVTTLGAGIFTPQAAAVVGMLVPPGRRIQAVTFVFLGWSLAAASATPLVKLVAANLGWREAMGMIALGSALAALAVWRKIPSGLRGVPISLGTWIDIARRPILVATLAITLITLAGIQVLNAYMVPFLAHELAAGASLTALLLALQGAAGVSGSALASRYGGRFGMGGGVVLATGAMTLGFVVLGLFGHVLAGAILGCMLFGSGIFSSNSLQQARLIALAPAQASASVALNSSVVYLGMSLGAYCGGLMVTWDLALVPWAAAGFMALACGLSLAMPRAARP